MFEPYSDSSIAGSHIGVAAQWVEQLLLGSLGMAIAVLAIGLMGFRMLLGYSSPREMGRILLGCFILFGAPAIARALTGGGGYHYAAAPRDVHDVPAPLASAPAPNAPQMPPATTNPFDPYAGSTSAH